MSRVPLVHIVFHNCGYWSEEQDEASRSGQRAKRQRDPVAGATAMGSRTRHAEVWVFHNVDGGIVSR